MTERWVIHIILIHYDISDSTMPSFQHIHVCICVPFCAYSRDILPSYLASTAVHAAYENKYHKTFYIFTQLKQLFKVYKDIALVNQTIFF